MAHYTWNWPLWKALLPVSIFLFFDVAYFSANLLKFVDGGYVAVSIALVLTVVMVTWRDGRAILAKRFEDARVPIDVILRDIQTYKLVRTPGTAAFLSLSPSGTPLVLLHHLKHSESLHRRVILLSILATDTPFVARGERLAITDLPC